MTSNEEINQSIQFYSSIGLSLGQQWGDHYAEMEAPGIKIGLHPGIASAKATGSGITSIGFIANDFSAVKSKLKSLGIECIDRKEEGGDFVHFQDPEKLNAPLPRTSLKHLSQVLSPNKFPEKAHEQFSLDLAILFTQ